MKNQCKTNNRKMNTKTNNRNRNTFVQLDQFAVASSVNKKNPDNATTARASQRDANLGCVPCFGFQ